MMMKEKIFLAFLSVASNSGAVVIFQKSDIRIGAASPTPVTAQSYQIDINRDGMTDLSIGVQSTENFSSIGLFLPIGVTPTTTLFIHRTPEIEGLRNELVPLARGSLIGDILDQADYRFLNVSDSKNTVLGTRGGDADGKRYWGPFYGQPGYLGFRFDAADGPHFGYLYLQEVDYASAVITSYAWETEPGKGIVTGAIPEPGSVLLLALGILTLGLIRRRSI